MKTESSRKHLRRLVKIVMVFAAVLVLAFLVYFPGAQTPIAFTLATGIGISGLQARVDQMENQAVFEKYGEHNAQSFPLPNAKSIIFGSQYCLRIDDGLGGHLVALGIAKPFLVYSEWTESVDASILGVCRWIPE